MGPSWAAICFTGRDSSNLSVSTWLWLHDLLSKTGDSVPSDKVTLTDERITRCTPLNCSDFTWMLSKSSPSLLCMSFTILYVGHWKLISSYLTFFPHIGNLFKVYLGLITVGASLTCWKRSAWKSFFCLSIYWSSSDYRCLDFFFALSKFVDKIISSSLSTSRKLLCFNLNLSQYSDSIWIRMPLGFSSLYKLSFIFCLTCSIT